MKKITTLLCVLALFSVSSTSFAAGWDRRHDDPYRNVGDWYAGHWVYGSHRDGSGWWWVTPGGGWNLFPQAVYPYPEPPIPIPPPVVIAAPPAAPPVVVTSPYYVVSP